MNKTWVLCATDKAAKKKKLYILLCVHHAIGNCELKINELSPAPQDYSAGPEHFPLQDFSEARSRSTKRAPSSVQGHVGCFLIWAILNNTSGTMGAQISLQVILFPLDIFTQK